jgi:hypothetical protein
VSKHTPGPWGLGKAYGRREVTLKREHWEIGSSVTLSGVAIAFAPHERDGDQANAHLIAAAPEMLTALRLVVENYQRDQVSGNFLGDDDHEAWTLCNAAIAKAEGRS